MQNSGRRFEKKLVNYIRLRCWMQLILLKCSFYGNLRGEKSSRKIWKKLIPNPPHTR